MNTNFDNKKHLRKIRLCRKRRQVWLISGIAIILSFLGFIFSYLNPSIGLPLRPGIDFTGGTQISIERDCTDNCEKIDSLDISNYLGEISISSTPGSVSPSLTGASVQILDRSKNVILRLPFLDATQSKQIVSEMELFTGPFTKNGISIDTIGPSLGKQLLTSSLFSLLIAFTGIAVYINFRFDRTYSFLALLALAHDIIIVCGIFSWLGIFLQVEINSLFAVALLTIAGYSVNDTVVVFDRIRELNGVEDINNDDEKIDIAISATLTRTLYTSGTTLLPLIALIIFGGESLYWFAIALAIGVIVGSWSSIALSPTLLSVIKTEKKSLRNIS